VAKRATTALRKFSLSFVKLKAETEELKKHLHVIFSDLQLLQMR